MKRQLLHVLTAVILFLMPNVNYGQAPTLGTTSNFAIFTAAGAFSNVGASTVTGDVGTGAGAFTGFPPGTLVGQIHAADPTSVIAATDVATAYSNLSATAAGTVIGATLGNGQVLTAGIYSQGAASTLNGTLTLDGGGNANAMFIIKIGGALSANASSTIVLIGSASACNVYWQVNGAFSLAAGSVFTGTVVASGAITLLSGAILNGRALTTGGLVSISAATVTIPTGCGATAAAITTAPTNSTVTSGGSASFSVVATGTGLTYQWRKGTVNLINGGNISGATSATLTINPVTISDVATNYNVVVSGTVGTPVTSPNVSLVVNAAAATDITTMPASQTICQGSSVSFAVIAVGTDLTYQWRKGTVNLVNGGNISGATSATVTINPAAISDVAANYNVVVSGTVGPNVTSTNVSLVFNTVPSITTVPVTNTSCAGSSASLSVVATGTGLTYQWRKGTVNLINGGNISGATSATLTVNPLNVADAGTNYNVVISGTCSPAATSANVSLIVNTAPGITTAPANQIVCSGNSASFPVVATGTGLTYQWRKGTVNLVNGGNVSGSTSATLTINPATISDIAANYNVVISGTCAPNATSANVSLTVSTALSITTAPVNQTSCAGSSASLSVVATGTGLTYQWRKGTVNLINGGNISGATSATLTVNPLNVADAGTNYNVVISGTCSPAATSANVSLIVNTAPGITTAPANQIVCSGNSASFPVVATGTGLTYQWRKGTLNLVNGGNVSGAMSATLTINPATISDIAVNYNVVISGTCASNATSANISLIAMPNIITEPNSQMTIAGGSASFSVTALGTDLMYQWRKGTVNLTNGGNISGANSSTLTINPVGTPDAGANYNVVITGTCAPISTSVNASLWICACTGTDIPSVDAVNTNTVNIYPNPFSTSLGIVINEASQIDYCELRIFNVSGTEVMNTIITKQVTTFDAGNLPSGTYFYQVISDHKTIQSGKLISRK